VRELVYKCAVQLLTNLVTMQIIARVKGGIIC